MLHNYMELNDFNDLQKPNDCCMVIILLMIPVNYML